MPIPAGAAGAALATQIIAGSSSFIQPFQRSIVYAMNYAWPNLEPDLQTLIINYKNTGHDIDLLYERAKSLGHSQDQVNRILNSMDRYLSVEDYVILYRRKHLTYNELVAYADRLFIPQHTLDLMLKVTEYYPPPADLVRFAVREVYTPEIVQKYNLLGDLPQAFLDAAEKSGLPEDQAKNYWASHWQLPSPNMGFEMFQRGIITEEELKTLLKTLDISPAWRDKLISLNYNVLTRVDVRRMWDFGVITEYGELVTAYRNVGYSPDDARKMADFTIAYTSNEMEGITRANIGDAYVKGIFGNDTLKAYLQALNKSDTFVEYWYEYYVWKRTEQRIDEREQEIIEIYLNGGIGYDEIRNLLIKDGASIDYIEYLLRKVQSKLSATIKQPSREDVSRWFKTGVISTSTYFTYMRKLHYTDETIQYYFTELIDEKNPVKRKFLTNKEYVDFYLEGYMTLEQLMLTLADKGLTLDDISLLIKATEENLNATTSLSKST